MAKVVIDVPAVHRQTTEMTMRYVRKILDEIRFNARLKVAHGPYTFGNLARSIERDGPYPGAGRVRGSVGSNLFYAKIVHDGAGLHGPSRSKYPIRAVRTKYLRFYWRKVGRVVTFLQVSHPGQRGKHYLTDALRIVAARHGLRVRIIGE